MVKATYDSIKKKTFAFWSKIHVHPRPLNEIELKKE